MRLGVTRVVAAGLLLGVSACGSDPQSGNSYWPQCEATAYARAHPEAELVIAGMSRRASGGGESIDCVFSVALPSTPPQPRAGCASFEGGNVLVVLAKGRSELAIDQTPPDADGVCYVHPTDAVKESGR